MELKTYNEIYQEVSKSIASIQDANEIPLLQDALLSLEDKKYQSARMISMLTLKMLASKKKLLNNMLTTSDPAIKKLLSSSTMTNLYINMELGEEQLILDSLVDLMRNIRGSIDTMRSLLSTAKEMTKI